MSSDWIVESFKRIVLVFVIVVFALIFTTGIFSILLGEVGLHAENPLPFFVVWIIIIMCCYVVCLDGE